MASIREVARRAAPLSAVLVVALATASSANAAATYANTYVAGAGGIGVGSASDSNTCNSESTPCATLAGALAQTSAGGTVELSGTLSQNGNVGANDVTIEANPDGTTATIQGSSDTTGLLVIGSGTVTVIGITFTGGDNTGDGGAIDNGSGGTLIVHDSTFTNDGTDVQGGAIANGTGSGHSGTLEVTGSTFSDNSTTNGYGSAIANGTQGGNGNATVTDSSFNGNVANSDGGGTIDNGSYGAATLVVTGSTFSANLTGSAGGAIGSWDGTGVRTTVSDSTFQGNTAVYGGALFNTGSNDDLIVSDSTFINNSASNSGGAIENAVDGAESTNDKLTLTGSTLSNDSAPLGSEIDTGGPAGVGGTGTGVNTGYLAGDLINGTCNAQNGMTVTDYGYNAVTDDSCLGGSTTTGDVVSAAVADLGSLANNGGPTSTMLPLAANPAINLIADATSVNVPAGSGTVTVGCPVAADQRGDANSGTTGCDVGSVQYAEQSAAFTVPSSAVVGQSPTALSTLSSATLPISYSIDSSTTHSACNLSGDSLSFIHAGSCVIDANQAGSANFAAAPQDQQTVTVAAANTSTSLTVGSSALKATVSASAPGGGTPTGSVQFQTGGEVLGTAALTSGTATLNYTVPANTTEQITASYEGNSDYTGSSGSASASGPTVQTTTTPVKAPVVNPAITVRLHSSVPRTRSGWWSAPVTATFSCIKHGSPLVGGCPNAVTFKHSGKDLGLRRTITARNGGHAKLVISGLKIDLSKPSVSIAGPEPRAVYQLTSPRARCVARDPVSGLRSCKMTRHVTPSRVGVKVTYTATATSNAGTTGAASETVEVHTITLLGARLYHGTYQVTPGVSYVLEVVSSSRPDYVDASVAPFAPNGIHPYFVRHGTIGGVTLWRLNVRMEPGLADFRLWNIGVLINGRTRTLRLHA